MTGGSGESKWARHNFKVAEVAEILDVSTPYSVQRREDCAKMMDDFWRVEVDFLNNHPSWRLQAPPVVASLFTFIDIVSPNRTTTSFRFLQLSVHLRLYQKLRY